MFVCKSGGPSKDIEPGPCEGGQKRIKIKIENSIFHLFLAVISDQHQPPASSFLIIIQSAEHDSVFLKGGQARPFQVEQPDAGYETRYARMKFCLAARPTAKLLQDMYSVQRAT